MPSNEASSYALWLADVKSRIRQSQLRASLRLNSALLELYWNIGADIVARQAEAVWGSGVLRKLSADLRAEFPDMHGFSERNLKYMRMFHRFYSENPPIGQQPVAQLTKRASAALGTKSQIVEIQSDIIGQQPVAPVNLPPVLAAVPWGHHIALFTHCQSPDEALFYIGKTAKNGWSRAVLLNFLDSNLWKRQGKALNNFDALLPKPQSDLARELLKDPYQFDFITLTEDYKERELEDALTSNITKFLLELEQGFAYIGRQVPVVVGEEEFFIDLLFYHLELRCFVAVELKAGKFTPKDSGQLEFYVAAVNHQKRKEHDNPTVGLLICKTKDNVVAKYALESSSQPIGISEYNLSNILPDDYKSSLPSIEEIETQLKTGDSHAK